MKKLLALPAIQVRRKKAFQLAAGAGQSRSEGRPAVTEITCAQWRAGCFNLVVGMGEASGCRAQSKAIRLNLKVLHLLRIYFKETENTKERVAL